METPIAEFHITPIARRIQQQRWPKSGHRYLTYSQLTSENPVHTATTWLADRLSVTQRRPWVQFTCWPLLTTFSESPKPA